MEGLLVDRVLERLADLSGRVIKFGINFLDDATLGIAPEELVIIGARTGTGKTELLNLIAESAARNARVAFFSLESHELEIEQRTLYREIHKKLNELPEADRKMVTWNGKLTYTQFARGKFNPDAMKLLLGSCGITDSFEKRYENLKVLYRKNPTAKTIENDILSMEGEIDLWILDHLHFLNYDSTNELDAVRTAMKLFYDVAAKQKSPLIIASHLRKDAGEEFPSISDLHGSSEISKRAVTTILIDQLPKNKFYAGVNDVPTLFHIAKFRIDGRLRRSYAVHQFNTVSRRYSDNYILMSKDEKGEIIIDGNQPPEWAVNSLSKEELQKRQTLY